MAGSSVRVLITGDAASYVRATQEASAASAVAAKEMSASMEKSSAASSGALSRLSGVMGGVFGPGNPASKGLDKMSAKFAEADTHGQKFGQAMSTLGGATLLGAAAGFAVVGTESVKMAMSFQSAMEMIHTQAGASQAEVKKMSEAVLNLAPKVGTGPDALAEALYHLESTGMRGAAALNALKLAAEGAKVGHANLEDVTNALDASIASGIPGVQNLGQAMGALNTIVGAGDMKMQDLADAMGSGVLAVVKGYGLSLNDVGAALATYGDNNIRGADAATKLRTAVQAMAVPAGTAKAALEKIGMTTHQLAADLSSGGLNKAITDLHTHLTDSGIAADQTGSILTEAFGKKAGPGIAILTDQFTRFQSKIKDIKDGAGGFDDAWKGTTQTLSYQMDTLKATGEALGTKFGMFLIPKVEQLGKAISGVISWFQKNKVAAELLGAAVATVLGAAVIKFSIDTAGKFLSAVGRMGQGVADFATNLFTTAPEVEAGMEGMGASATESAAVTDAAIGSTGIGAILIGLGIAVTLLLTHWKQVWGAIKDAALEVWHFMYDGVGKYILPFLGPMGLIAFGLIELSKHWAEVWGAIKTVMSDVWNFLKKVFDDITHAIGDVMGPLGTVVNIASKIGGGAVSFLTGGLLKAGGGSVAGGQPYIVGEAGPELFVPSVSGVIVPNGANGSIAPPGAGAGQSGGGSATIILQMANGVQLAQAFIPDLLTALYQHQRSVGNYRLN